MSTPFSKIINIFLNEMKSRDFTLIDSEDLIIYLDSLVITSANADFTYCTKDLSAFTESTLTVDGSFTATLTYEECNIIAKNVLMRYLNREVYNQELLRQDVGDHDFKLTSGHMLLSKLLDLKAVTSSDIKDLKYNYQYQYLTSDDLS